MVRSELIEALGERYPGLTFAQIEALVITFFDTLTEQLVANGRIELRGFGVFSTRDRKARIGLDPRNGRVVTVEAKRVPYFKPSKKMEKRLNLIGKS